MEISRNTEALKVGSHLSLRAFFFAFPRNCSRRPFSNRSNMRVEWLVGYWLEVAGINVLPFSGNWIMNPNYSHLSIGSLWFHVGELSNKVLPGFTFQKGWNNIWKGAGCNSSLGNLFLIFNNMVSTNNVPESTTKNIDFKDIALTNMAVANNASRQASLCANSFFFTME